MDGNYELFRYFFPLPSHKNIRGREVAATRGVLGSVLSMLESGVTHLGVATDHVIESFRNRLWSGYKTSAGVPATLFEQFPLLEEGLEALGVKRWAMSELEADDALGAAALRAEQDASVQRVYICSPDKDLAQCVRGERVVQLERRTGKLINEAGVLAKFGVAPDSIPDYLALVGDSADGYPGLPGWGSRSAATVLRRYRHLEGIPPQAGEWDVPLRGADKLAATLRDQLDLAYLFRHLATLRCESPVFEDVEELRWRGPTADFAVFCRRNDALPLLERALRASLPDS
ncbi:MAG TPA: 5'-3' exonuclease H3TH domain-containing protein [Dehalococcoidia bacterium]|nr:5'-3' exonuclease H3TH domain-containing protein [Dehalococcoidia bacterium]